MTEWEAEMPRERSYDDGRDGYGYACVAHACLVDDVRALVYRANEELAKVRAERGAALARVRELTEWRPMETAPTYHKDVDGFVRDEPVILLFASGFQDVAHRPRPNARWCAYVSGAEYNENPVGWLPRPEPPKGEP